MHIVKLYCTLYKLTPHLGAMLGAMIGPYKVTEEWLAQQFNITVAVMTGTEVGTVPAILYNKDQQNPGREPMFLVHHLSMDGAKKVAQHFSLISREPCLFYRAVNSWHACCTAPYCKFFCLI